MERPTAVRGWMNLKRASAYMGIGYSTFVRVWPEWTDRLGIRVARIGKHILIKASDIDRIVESRFIN